MMLEIRGINTFYGLGHILHGLSLRVAPGEVVALLGRNGAGKTTTLRSITGLTPPRSGEIAYKGAGIVGLPAHAISRLGIALVPETRGIFSYLTARENLEIARRPGSRWQLEHVLGRFPKLRERFGGYPGFTLTKLQGEWPQGRYPESIAPVEFGSYFVAFTRP